jgi:hypothetical protein
MADYLEEAAEALRQAQSRAEILADKTRGGELLLSVADGFTRLAAIERGLLPPDIAPAAVAEDDREDQPWAPAEDWGHFPIVPRLNRIACPPGGTV